MERVPSYLNLSDRQWKEKIEKALSMLESCYVCPHKCGVNRLKNEEGFCKTGRYAVVDSYFPHFGEEKPIRGIRGSGTVFFSWCNMKCVYCQNYQISQLGEGTSVTPYELSRMFLKLQSMGCHNVNLVTPSHVVPQIIESLYLAVKDGLRIPVVYNTSSYDSLDSIKLLDGIVDIYLADLKYASNDLARKYSKVKNYWNTAQEVIKEMYKQVGTLKLDDKGVAYRGLLVRHLILPNSISQTENALSFLKTIDGKLAVNIMNQYYPMYKALNYPELSRKITSSEYNNALKLADGLTLCID